MRIKIDPCPMLSLQLDTGKLLIAQEYQEKFEKISDLPDTNPAILNAVHRDLGKWGAEGGRESTYSSENFLRALLVKCVEGLSFRETVTRIADSAVLRNFTRLFSGRVMNFTVLDAAFKKIQPATWHAINALLEQWARTEKKISGKSLRLDSTVCEANIHYPTDASLLWDCYRVAARVAKQIREVEPVLVLHRRFHGAKVKKLYTFIATHSGKKKNSTKRKVKKCMGILLERVEGVVEVAREIVAFASRNATTIAARVLVGELSNYLPDMEQVIAQSRRAHAGETVPATERVFSIFEDHAELLMRGKEHKPVEFGHLVQIGQTEQKFISFYAVEQRSRHDSVMGDVALKDHKKSFGAYPERFAADKNYYVSMEHIEEWEEEIDIFSVCKKGNRTPEEIAREHGVLFKLAQKFRAGCEGSISVLKRVFGLRRCLNRGFNSFASAIGCLVFCHNLVLLSKL